MEQQQAEIILKPHERISEIHSAILSVLLYFDIFKYPLKKEEILLFCREEIKSVLELDLLLQELVDLKLIKNKQDFYHVNDNETVIEKRIEGNKLAAEILPKAIKYGKLISKFPFVKGVYISGSLSKGYADKDSDVDFFIITEPSKLWVCRTFLVGFKKIFLFNSRKYFCVNYFIDADSLEIADKNLFTATEICSLLPINNSDLYQQFMQQNSWIKTLLPNAKNVDLLHHENEKKPFIKNTIEKILRGSTGEILDKLFFKITLKRWKKKFAHFNINDFDLNMRSKKNVSKHHPNGFQQKVMKQYHEQLSNFEKHHKIKLVHD